MVKHFPPPVRLRAGNHRWRESELLKWEGIENIPRKQPGRTFGTARSRLGTA